MQFWYLAVGVARIDLTYVSPTASDTVEMSYQRRVVTPIQGCALV